MSVNNPFGGELILAKVDDTDGGPKQVEFVAGQDVTWTTKDEHDHDVPHSGKVKDAYKGAETGDVVVVENGHDVHVKAKDLHKKEAPAGGDYH